MQLCCLWSLFMYFYTDIAYEFNARFKNKRAYAVQMIKQQNTGVLRQTRKAKRAGGMTSACEYKDVNRCKYVFPFVKYITQLRILIFISAEDESDCECSEELPLQKKPCISKKPQVQSRLTFSKIHKEEINI